MNNYEQTRPRKHFANCMFTDAQEPMMMRLLIVTYSPHRPTAWRKTVRHFDAKRLVVDKVKLNFQFYGMNVDSEYGRGDLAPFHPHEREAHVNSNISTTRKRNGPSQEKKKKELLAPKKNFFFRMCVRISCLTWRGPAAHRWAHFVYLVNRWLTVVLYSVFMYGYMSCANVIIRF